MVTDACLPFVDIFIMIKEIAGVFTFSIVIHSHLFMPRFTQIDLLTIVAHCKKLHVNIHYSFSFC